MEVSVANQIVEELRFTSLFSLGQTHIQRAGVQYIIDSVVQALQRNPERR